MNSEELKDRVKDDLGQMLEAHGIKADISEHHVEKLNASYDALSVTPRRKSHRCECESQCYL